MHVISLVRPSCLTSPLTLSTILRSGMHPPNSSRVTIHGPIAVVPSRPFPDKKSIPIAPPGPFLKIAGAHVIANCVTEHCIDAGRACARCRSDHHHQLHLVIELPSER